MLMYPPPGQTPAISTFKNVVIQIAIPLAEKCIQMPYCSKKLMAMFQIDLCTIRSFHY